MKKIIKKSLCLLLALVLVFSLCACSTDPNCGMYICKSAKVEDITVNADQAFINGASIELKKAGACDVILDGVKYSGSWKSKDNKITIDLQETSSEATISGNSFTVDLFGVGMVLTFEKV